MGIESSQLRYHLKGPDASRGRSQEEWNRLTERCWNILFSDAQNYEETFSQVLGEDTLKSILERWNPSDTAVLDMMGYGEVLHDLNVQHGLAVALTDKRDKYKKTKHGPAIDMVTGNILSAKTWRAIDDWLHIKAPDDHLFKLILARPEGGLQTLPQRADYGAVLIDRLYRRLSSQEGTMLVQTIDTFDDDLPAWVHLLNNTPGITAVHQTLQPEDGKMRILAAHNITSSAIRITKSAGAPPRLPFSNKIH